MFLLKRVSIIIIDTKVFYKELKRIVVNIILRYFIIRELRSSIALKIRLSYSYYILIIDYFYKTSSSSLLEVSIILILLKDLDKL